MVTERHERGQLILITAIAVAFILLAIIIVFNGLLFTQTIASEDASKATEDVMSAEQELEEGIHGVVLRSNIEKGDINLEEDEAMGSYIDMYQDSVGNSSPAIVDVSPNGYNAGLLRGEDIDQDDIDDDLTIFPVEEGSDPLKIGYFALEIETDQTIYFNVDESEDHIEIWLSETDTSGCPISDEIWVDLVKDTDEDCDRTLSSEGDSYDSIEFRYEADDSDDDDDDDDDVEFTINYALVVEDRDGAVEEYIDEEVNDYYDAAWSVDVTYSYDSNDITATRTFEIENVYDDADHLWPRGGLP